MRIYLRKKHSGEIEFGIIFGSLAIMTLVTARYLPLMDVMPSCLFKEFTGFPCPTCGTTRSLVNLAKGDLQGSLLMNPAFALAMIVTIFWFLYNSIIVVFNTSRFALSLTRPESDTVRVAALAILLLNWCYLGLSM
jgi:hypothetical protein